MHTTQLEMLLEWLWGPAWQNFIATAILVPVVMLLCRFFHRRPAVQHLLWLLLLVKFMTPQIPGVAWLFPGGFGVSRANAMQSSAGSPGVAASPLNRWNHHFAFEPKETSIDGEKLIVANSWAHRTKTVERSAQVVFVAAALIWIAGAVRMLTIYLTSWRKQLRILRASTPASANLRELVGAVAKRVGAGHLKTVVSADVTSPFLSCASSVQLVWPECLASSSPETQRSLIAHEVAHVRRNDHLVAWLETIATILWWWNPIFWFVRRQLRCTAEMACDAIALDAFPDDRCYYAEKLLELSANFKTGAPPLVLAVGGGTPSSIERRIAMIVSDRVRCKLGYAGLSVAISLGICAIPGWTFSQTDNNARTVETETAVDLNAPGTAQNSDSSTGELGKNPSKQRRVLLSDGAEIPLDSEGMLLSRHLGESHIIDWNGPLTIAESAEPLRVRLRETPLVLDLRTGEGVRQALIRLRSNGGATIVQLQVRRAVGKEPIRLDIQALQSRDAGKDQSQPPEKLTLLTPTSDIEAISIEGSISIRMVAIAEGRTGAINSALLESTKAKVDN